MSQCGYLLRTEFLTDALEAECESFSSQREQTCWGDHRWTISRPSFLFLCISVLARQWLLGWLWKPQTQGTESQGLSSCKDWSKTNLLPRTLASLTSHTREKQGFLGPPCCSSLPCFAMTYTRSHLRVRASCLGHCESQPWGLHFQSARRRKEVQEPRMSLEIAHLISRWVDFILWSHLADGSPRHTMLYFGE